MSVKTYLLSLTDEFPEQGVHVSKDGVRTSYNSIMPLMSRLQLEASKGHKTTFRKDYDHYLIIDTGVDMGKVMESFGTNS